MRHRDPLTTPVLRLLRQDGRASYTRIAETLGISRKRVTEIVQRAVDTHEVVFTVSVSPDLLGLQRFGYVQLRMDGPVGPARAGLIAMPETTFVADITGDAPLDTEIRVGPDPHLRHTLERIRALPHVSDIRTHVYESIEINLYSPLRTGRTGMSLDRTDRAIVRHLQRDGRATYAELGESVGVSASAARLRLRRLVAADALKVVGVPARHADSDVPTLGVGIRTRGALDPAVQLVRSLEPEFLAIAIGEYELIATLRAQRVADLVPLVDRLVSSPEVATLRTWTNLRMLKEEYGRGELLSVKHEVPAVSAAAGSE